MYKHYRNKKARSEYMKIYNKKWAKDNSVKLKEYKKNYMKKYRITHRDSLIRNNKKWRIRNLSKVKQYSKMYYKSLDGKYSKYKNGSKYRGYEFNLTKNDFSSIIAKPCIYCGTQENIGIDRLNNNIGYLLDNCVPCCSECNYIKGSKDIKYFEKCLKIYHVLLKRMVG